MRIAFFAAHQSEKTLAQRSIKNNRALAGSLKMRLVAEALAMAGHDIVMFSNGLPAERSGKIYPSFEETLPAKRPIRLIVAAGLDVHYINQLVSLLSLKMLFKKEHQKDPFHLVMLYNLSIIELRCAFFIKRRFGLPIIVEYEDDALVNRTGNNTVFNSMCAWYIKKLQPSIKGCFAPSPELLTQFPGRPTYLLRGIISPDLVEAASSGLYPKEKIVLFAATLAPDKGTMQLIEAWSTIDPGDWQLHITGEGPLASLVREKSGQCKSIVFHGLLSRKAFLELLCKARIGINPHQHSEKPGNVFPFKLIEYVAAGAHILTTRMGAIDKGMESGVSYIKSDTAEEIRKALKVALANDISPAAIAAATGYVNSTYGFNIVSKELNALLRRCI